MYTLKRIGGHYLSLKCLKYFLNQGKKINITHSTEKITSKNVSKCHRQAQDALDVIVCNGIWL